jgi:hypothetical protein
MIVQTTTRRLFLTLALAAAAFPAAAAPDSKTVAADKAFPYLEGYLKLPPAERSRFTVAYFITNQAGKPASGLKAWIVQGGQKTPAPIGADGRVQRLPTLREIEGKAQITFEASSQQKFGMQLAVEPLVRNGTEIDAPALAAAIAQSDAAAHKLAGVLGFAAPKMSRVYFKGVQGGEAVLADGRVMKLGALKGLPFYDPTIQRGAKIIRFANAPTLIEIGPAG